MPKLNPSPQWRETIREAIENPVSEYYLENTKDSTEDTFSKIQDWENDSEAEMDRICKIFMANLPSDAVRFFVTKRKYDELNYWIRLYHEG